MTHFSSPRSPAKLETRRRAARQVAGPLAVSALLAVAGLAYLAFGDPLGGSAASVSDVRISHLTLGLCLGAALLLAGIGVVRWSRTLTSGTETVEYRSDADTDGSDRHGQGWPMRTGLRRRRLIRNVLLGTLALLPLPAFAAVRSLDPAAVTRRRYTAWDEGVRLLTEVGHRPLRASDLQVGEMVSVLPASYLDLPDAGPARLNERAKSPVVLVRMRPDELAPASGRENWHVDGIIAYSKICTHVGCPVSLYDRTTHHLLCPCHQATFDLADNGTVVFGPATRPLPQLPIAVDGDGFLVAQRDFTEAIGPSYWEREA